METSTQVRQRDMRVNHRRREAKIIGQAIFSEIRDILPCDVGSEVCERIMATLYRNGVLLVREDERSKLGLEPLDEAGWTPSERVKFEQDKTASMHMTAHIAVNLSDPRFGE